jgi:twitching motility protein PilI
MARVKLDLQAYQQDILARLKDLTADTNSKTVSKLGVVINGSNWLIALDDVSEVIPLPEITRVPQTQAWFMGMANVRGNLYALTDLARFFGYPATQISPDARILLVHQKFDVNAGLLVERLIGLRASEDMEKQENPDEQAIWSASQYKDSNHEVWHELNISQLLNQQAFMQVAA